ncbi:MAG TPA: hypothetical protein VNT79_19270 [Phycisphaerae bacterium]|nr:hypothetical protein [Phycisphaerae bacterium]
MATHSHDPNSPNTFDPPGAAVAATPPPRHGLFAGPVGLVLSVVLLGTAGVLVWRTFAFPEYVEPDAIPTMYVCAETNLSFLHTPQIGETFPVPSPHSKKNTGYPAERCFWTRDGKVKATPTYVLLNHFVNKPPPTICPDCGREVFPHNPKPEVGPDGQPKNPPLPVSRNPRATEIESPVAPTTQP